MSDHWNEGWSENTIEGALAAKAEQERDTARRDHVRSLAYKIGVLGETDLDLLIEAGKLLGLNNGTRPADLPGGKVQPERQPNRELPSDDSGFPPAPRALREEAFHGLAGRFVHTVDPHTEADPAATLVQFLAAFGNACGRGPGFRVESDKHGTNEFIAIVGETSKARKGSSWGHVRRVMKVADSEWAVRCIGSGIASGEGLIHAVRDPRIERRKPRTKEEKKEAEFEPDGRIEDEVDPGVDEKRLLVIQGELAQVLRVMQREGNTVSPILRDLWDHGNAQGMSKNQPERTTDSLVTLIGHITVRELRRELTEIEAGNGFANRWLFVCARRSKLLPHGGSLTDDDLAPVGFRVGEALKFARTQGILGMTEDARELWDALYKDLSETGADLLAAVTGRAEAHVRRLAVLYALLDKADRVDVEHLRAAIAVWDYCAASAAHIFGGRVGDPVADKILAALREAPEGLTRTAIRAIVGGHVPAEEIEDALRFLAARGLAHEITVPTAGRPANLWKLGTRSKVPEASEESPTPTPFAPTAQALSSGSEGVRERREGEALATPEEEARAARLGVAVFDDDEGTA